MDLRQRFKLALSFKGIKAIDLAKLIGTSDAYLAVMVKRGSPRDRLEAVAVHLGIDPGWLIDGNPSLSPSLYRPGTSPALQQVMARVEELKTPYEINRGIDLPLVATTGAASDGQRGVPLDHPEMTQLRPDLALVRVYGDSASPVALDGQYAVIVDREPGPDHLALVETPDGLVLKRWCPQPDRLVVVLASPNGGRGSLTFPIAELGRRWLVVGILYPEAISPRM